MLLAAWLPFLVRAVQIYASANFQQVAFLAPTPQMFREFLDQQEIFVFIVSIVIGAGLIADDRRANALQIYLSKPLTRVEYIAGKLITLARVLTFVTWLPAMLLLLLQMLFAGSTKFLREHLFLIPAITLFAGGAGVRSSFAMLALSSLSKSRRFVAMMYAGILFFTAAMYQALRPITASTRVGRDFAARHDERHRRRHFPHPGPARRFRCLRRSSSIAVLIGASTRSCWSVVRGVGCADVPAALSRERAA